MGLEQRIDDLEIRVANLEKKIEHLAQLDLLRKELSQPVERTPGDIAQALKIVGIGEGPRDMARNARRYLYECRQ